MATEELDKAEGQLNEEADEDAGLRSQHGAAWNRPASAALNSSLREKVASYRCDPRMQSVIPGRFFRPLADPNPKALSSLAPSSVSRLQQLPLRQNFQHSIQVSSGQSPTSIPHFNASTDYLAAWRCPALPPQAASSQITMASRCACHQRASICAEPNGPCACYPMYIAVRIEELLAPPDRTADPKCAVSCWQQPRRTFTLG